MIRRPPRSPLFPYPPLFRSVADLDIAAAVQDQPAVLALEYLVAFVPAGPFAALRQRGGGASRRGRQAPLQERLEHGAGTCRDRKSTRLNSSHANISYAVFCL